MDISQKAKGGLVKETTLRDYRLDTLGGAPVLPTKFSLRDKVGRIEDQGQSSSCGSQATAYYTEVLNAIETGSKVQLSPRFLYAYVGYKNEGSYIKDNVQRIIDAGIALEDDVPSYQNNVPPTEDFMLTKPVLTQQQQDTAKMYLAKKYLTWDNTNLEIYKRAIINGNGVIVASWGNNVLWTTAEIGLPDVPSQMAWRHIIYIIGYDDTTKKFEFVNSWSDQWGDKGFGYLPYEYATRGFLSNPYTLIDVPNTTYVSLMSIIENLKDKIAKLLKLKK